MVEEGSEPQEIIDVRFLIFSYLVLNLSGSKDEHMYVLFIGAWTQTGAATRKPWWCGRWQKEHKCGLFVFGEYIQIISFEENSWK